MPNLYKKILIYTLLLSTIAVSIWTNIPRSISSIQNVMVAGKAFNDAECIKYLDRPIRSYGYQPVQLIINNHSNKNLIFAPEYVNMHCMRLEDITSEAHTSTVGRVIGYSTAALVFGGIFFVPAIIDGIASSNANRALDADYFSKIAKRTTILQHTKMNAIVFIPLEEYSDNLEIKLLEEGTTHLHTVSVRMYA